MSDVSLDFDSGPLKRNVRDATGALDELLGALSRVEAGLGKFNKAEDTSLRKTMDMVRKIGDNQIKLIVEAQKTAHDTIHAGNLTQLNLTRDLNRALQSLYEGRLAMQGKLSSEELAQWKSLGVNIDKLNKQQLKSHEESVKAAEKLEADRLAILSGASRGVATLRQKLDKERLSANESALKADLAGYQNMLRLKTAAALSAQRAEEEAATKTAALVARANTGVAALRQKLDKERLSANESALKADLAGYQNMLRLKVAAHAKAEKDMLEAAKASVQRATYSAQGPYSSLKTGKVVSPPVVADDVKKAVSGGLFKKLGDDMGYAHSAARGLASGFGLLWLTWGKLVPLMAGASISFGIRKVFDVGSEVERQIRFMQEMSGVIGDTARISQEGSTIIRDELRKINKATEFTLTDLSKGMTVLGQAGLNAADSLKVLPAAADMATAAMMPLEDAINSLVQIQGIYSLSSAESAKQASMLVKATQDTPVTVKQLTESLKMVSEANSRFDQSLESSVAIISKMSETQIKGSVAGTAYINMMRDLTGRTESSRKELEKLEKATGTKLNIFKDDGKTIRDAIDILDDLMGMTKKLNPKEFQEFVQKFFTDRGGRAVFTVARESAEGIRAFRDAIAGVPADLAKMQAQGLLDTVIGQMNVFKSNLSNTLDEIYAMHEGRFKLFFKSLTSAVDSPEFKSGLNSIVNGFITLADWVDRNSTTIKNLVVGFLAFKAAMLGQNFLAWAVGIMSSLAMAMGRGVNSAYALATANAGVVATTRAVTVSAVGGGSAITGMSAASLTASASMTALAATSRGGAAAVTAMTWAVKAFNATVKVLTGPIGWILLAGTALYTLYSMLSNNGPKAAEDFSEAFVKNSRLNSEALDVEIRKLRERNRLLGVDEGSAIFTKAREGLFAEKANVAAKIAAAEDKLQKFSSSRYKSASAIENTKKEIEDLKGLSASIDRDIRQTHLKQSAYERKKAKDEEARRQKEEAKTKPKDFGTLTLPDSTSGPREFTNQYTAAIQDNISALNARADAEVRSAKAAYDASRTILDAKRSAELISEGAYRMELLQLQATYEHNQLAIITRSNQEISKERDRIVNEETARTQKTLEQSRLKGAEFDKFKIEAEKNLAERLASVRERSNAELEKNTAQAEQIEQEAYRRREVAAIEYQGVLRKLQKDAQDYWKSVTADAEQQAAADSFEARWKHVTDISSAAAKSEKAAAKARLDAANKHRAQLDKLKSFADEAAKSIADAESALDKLQGPPTADMAQHLALLKQGYETATNELATHRKKTDEDVARAGAKAYGDAMRAEFDALQADIEDVLMTAIFEGGKAGRTKLKDLLKSSFKNFVLDVAVRPIAGIGASILAPMLGIKAGGGIGGTINTLNSAYSLYQGIGQMGSLASSAGILSGATYGTAAGSAQSIALAMQEMGASTAAIGSATGSAAGAAAQSGWASQIGAFMSNPWTIAAGSVLALIAGSGRELKESGIRGMFGGEEGFTGESYKFFDGKIFSSNKTETGELDATLQKELAKSFKAMQDSTAVMAKSLGFGTEAIDNFTARFQLNLKDLSDEESAKKIQEELGKVQEQMAQAALNAWAAKTITVDEALFAEKAKLEEEFVKYGSAISSKHYSNVLRDIEAVQSQIDDAYMSAFEGVAVKGETAMQTLTRLSGSLTAVNDSFTLMNKALLDSSVKSAEFASKIVEAFGTLDQYTAAFGSYMTNYYSEDEQKSFKLGKLNESFKELGLALPSTREGFRELVEGQNLATEEGRSTYAALLKLSDVFAEVTAAAESSGTSLKDQAMSQLEAAIDREKSYWQVQISAAESLRDEVEGIFDLLRDAVRDIREEALGPAVSSEMAQSQIAAMVSAAQSTGALPDSDALSSAISAARGGMGLENFGSTAEQKFAQLALAGQLETLQFIAGGQLSEAERQLRVSQQQLEALDATLEWWQTVGNENMQAQIEATLSVTEAVNQLADILDPTGEKRGLKKQDQTSNLLQNFSAYGESPESYLSQMPSYSNSTQYQYLESLGTYVNIGSHTMAQGEHYLAGRLQEAFWSPEADMLDTWNQLTGSLFAGSAENLLATVSGLLPDNIIDSYRQEFMNTIPAFANGGIHSGGLAMVGENGPELVDFGPSRIYNTSNTQDLLDNTAVREEVSALREEVANLTSVMIGMSIDMRRTAEATNGRGEAPILTETV